MNFNYLKRMRWLLEIVMFIFIVNTSVLLFSDDTIIVGKKYTQDEINEFTNLVVYAEVTIEDSILMLYKIEDGRRWTQNTNKIAVLKDSSKKYLDAIGLILPDNYCYETTYISNSVCAIKVYFDDSPINRFLYVDSKSDKINFYTIPHKFVGFICFSEPNIYYSTERDDTTIWRVNTANGEIYTYPTGYNYVNVDLYKVKGSERIMFVYEGKIYLIIGDSIVLTDEKLDVENNIRLKEYLRK